MYHMPARVKTTTSLASPSSIWISRETALLNRLKTPEKIQAFLDSLRYNPGWTIWSPREVMRRRSAHCLEGALLACAALEHHGQPSGLLELDTQHDLAWAHVVTVFRREGLYGAVAKSNYSTLRYRSPAYRSLRELAMSYFDFYHNRLGDLVLRSYAYIDCPKETVVPGWRTRERDLLSISWLLTAARHHRLIPESLDASLRPADKRLLAAELLGAVKAGLFPLKKRVRRD